MSHSNKRTKHKKIMEQVFIIITPTHIICSTKQLNILIAIPKNLSQNLSEKVKRTIPQKNSIPFLKKEQQRRPDKTKQ